MQPGSLPRPTFITSRESVSHVGLFDAVRDLLLGSGRATTGDEETFEYRCRDCEHEFESTRPHVTAASCPDCGSDDVWVSDDPYRSE